MARRLFGSDHEVTVRADTPHANVVLDKDPADVAGAEGDCDDVPIAPLVYYLVGLVCEGNVLGGGRVPCVETLV